MNQKSERRLAAVLALDVVGYSRMMGEEEGRTLDRLLHRRKTIVDPMVLAHRGHVIKGTGDGVLAEFASVKDALNAAVGIQTALIDANMADANMAETNAGEGGDQPMLARIGINAGDVIFEGGDIYGDGVNIAARLEATAPPGGICVSGNAVDEVRRLGVAYQDAGELALKNISTPVRAYHIPPEAIASLGYRPPASGEALDAAPGRPSPERRAAPGGTGFRPWRSMAIAAAGLVLLVVAAGAWFWLRPAPAAAHSMMVHLPGFRPSADLPATLRESVNAEIAAAFNVEGVIGVSTAPAPAPGAAPPYSLGGTLYRVGDSIRVITRFTNERSGVVLWSDSVDYPADQVSKIPHKIAVDAGTVIRCGLSGAATYRKALPDPVLANYMQYCQEYWTNSSSRTLRFAQLVVAAVPDFSWGWSAVGNGFKQAADLERDGQRAQALRAAGREAEDKAVALDRNNSEALAHKAYLIDEQDWAGQEALFKSAIAAKPLDCGCEHYGYGLKLQSVGRLGAAIEQFRAATDMLALWPNSQIALARMLVAADRADQAKPYFDAAIDLSKDLNYDKRVAVADGVETGDYKAAMAALASPQLQIPKESRAALLSGYEALASNLPERKTKAVQELAALPKDKQSDSVVAMLGALGANRQALEAVGRRPWLFWRKSMRGVLGEPAFPAAAQELGLMTYWKTSHTRPDACLTKSPPAFCRMI